jgi:succinate dehydrogenase / fumarate reductase cytochrome b subunit
MSTATATAEVTTKTTPHDAARGFLLSRLGSLFSILPLGVWTLFHLWNNLASYSGPRAWQQEVTEHSSEASSLLVSLFVLIPLFWHMIWGIMRMGRSRPELGIGWFSNVRYIVQRLSALGLLGFLGAHLYLAWFSPRFLEHHPESFRDIAAHMHHHLPTTIVYALGILAVAYHLANGLWSFAMGWGLTVSRASQNWMQTVMLILFVIFLAIGWGAEYGLYSAGASFPAPLN